MTLEGSGAGAAGVGGVADRGNQIVRAMAAAAANGAPTIADHLSVFAQDLCVRRAVASSRTAEEILA